MSYRMLPVMFVMSVVASAAHAQGLEDFSRLARAIGKEVSIVEQSGVVREGIVEAATADAVTLRFGSAIQSFPRETVARAERTRDRSTDGALKGAIFGAVTGALTMRAYQRHSEWLSPGADRAGMFLMHVASWSALGWVFDAVNTHREPIYRAPAPTPATSLKISFRF